MNDIIRNHNRGGNAMSYKLTMSVEICFDYYPYCKTTSEEVPLIVNHDETAYYDEMHEITLEITPKMLLECMEYVYKYVKEKVGLFYKDELIRAFEKCPFYFERICAEIFDDDNLNDYSSVHDYLLTTDEYKKKEREIIENEVRGLGELYE